jgi:hypothetical protein
MFGERLDERAVDDTCELGQAIDDRWGMAEARHVVTGERLERPMTHPPASRPPPPLRRRP